MVVSSVLSAIGSFCLASEPASLASPDVPRCFVKQSCHSAALLCVILSRCDVPVPLKARRSCSNGYNLLPIRSLHHPNSSPTPPVTNIPLPTPHHTHTPKIFNSQGLARRVSGALFLMLTDLASRG